MRIHLLSGSFVLTLSALGWLSGCSAGAPVHSSGGAQAGGSGSSATGANGGVGGSNGQASGAASNLGGASGTLNLVVMDAGSSDGGGTSDTWPSSACQHGAAIVADTGEYCQGPAYQPSMAGGTIKNDSGCGSTLWGIARDFIGYNQVATNPPGMAHPDFGSHYCCGIPTGTVLSTLGADDKPVYKGDDDLWVFIDKKLAIDLGGIHTSQTGMVILDQFAAQAGLVVGKVYGLDLFNAERHPGGSHFKITTSMTFVDCGVVPVVPK